MCVCGTMQIEHTFFSHSKDHHDYHGQIYIIIIILLFNEYFCITLLINKIYNNHKINVICYFSLLPFVHFVCEMCILILLLFVAYDGDGSIQFVT